MWSICPCFPCLGANHWLLKDSILPPDVTTSYKNICMNYNTICCRLHGLEYQSSGCHLCCPPQQIYRFQVTASRAFNECHWSSLHTMEINFTLLVNNFNSSGHSRQPLTHIHKYRMAGGIVFAIMLVLSSLGVLFNTVIILSVKHWKKNLVQRWA